MNNAQVIEKWLTQYLSKLLSIDISQVEPDLSFDNYGLDSLDAAQLTGELGDWIDLELEINVIYDYPTINQLSHYLAKKSEKEALQWLPH